MSGTYDTCQECGKLLPSRRSKYCSDECSGAKTPYYEKKRKACVICGRDLPSSRGTYCSDDCASKAPYFIKVPKTEIVCLNCGKTVRRSKGSLFCCNVCGSRFSRLRRSGYNFECVDCGGRIYYDQYERSRDRCDECSILNKTCCPLLDALHSCEFCGLHFIRSVANKKYCSNRCCNAANSRLKRRNPKFRLRSGLSSYIASSLRGRKAGRSWESLVGYSLDDLIFHLESQFTNGMSWENYGKDGWHVDHIVPVSFFVYETDEDPEFAECWNLSNLQPLWGEDNIRKNDIMPDGTRGRTRKNSLKKH